MMQQKLELTVRAEPDYSPWFNAVDYRPVIAGPYQHRTITENGCVLEMSMHWWDGNQWSRKLDYDPDLDDEIVAPPADHYPVYASEAEFIADVEQTQWRGFNSDQAPKPVAAAEDEF